jgi:uncharacterized membrane protein
LSLAGTLLYVLGSALTREMVWSLDLPPTALMAFIPALFGVLFGPWVGGLTGGLGLILWDALIGGYWYPPWGLVLAHSVPGLLSGLLAKDARNWKAVGGIGVVASVAFGLAIPVVIGITQSWWGDFGVLAGQFFVGSLLPNLVLLPLCARWLLRPVRQRGLYWRDSR